MKVIAVNLHSMKRGINRNQSSPMSTGLKALNVLVTQILKTGFSLMPRENSKWTPPIKLGSPQSPMELLIPIIAVIMETHLSLL